MPRISREAEAAAKVRALDFLKKVKSTVDKRKLRDRLDILARESATIAEYAERLVLASKAQQVLNRVARAMREGRLDADNLDREKLREIAGEALRDYEANRTMRTLLSTGYNAGRLAYQRGDATRPFWLYRTMRDGRVREQHARWEGILLPSDHLWWKTHYPPNGFNERCRVDALTPAQAADRQRINKSIRTEPPAEGTVTHIDRATGRAVRVPEGITPGFEREPDSSPEAVGKLLERQIALIRGWKPPV